MLRAVTVGATLAFLAGIVLVGSAAADSPNFGPAIYADDELFGTKGTADLPAPNGNNDQSFDKLFHIDGQDEAVAEAAPGNPDYNGGRWDAYMVTWNVTPVLVTSYEQLMALEAAGDVTITSENNYFQCPLLPDKSG
jgi:hypothetical protein